MNRKQKEYLLGAVLASIENYKWCSQCEERKRTVIYKIKYFIWFLLLITISPQREIESRKMVCATTPVNEKILKSYMNSDEHFCFAKLNSSINQMRINNSVLSPYSHMSRWFIFIQGIIFYNQFRKKLAGYLHFTLEYYSIANYINDHCIETIICPCIYDRYSTFLSYYAYAKSIEIIGVQDGAAIDINVPRKIFCNHMNCFDEFERNIIKKYIANEDCNFHYVGFSSTLNWKKYEKNNRYTIAIASQDWFTSKTLDLLNNLMFQVKDKKINVIVFPHYREKEEQYINIKVRYPQVVIEKGDRYANIDLLITFYSTIVYDFWSINPDLIVRCLRIPGYEPGYYRRKNVFVYNNLTDLINDSLKESNS